MPPPLKIASLRKDLKISKQVLSERISFVVKEPLKGEYFKFSEDEWRIIVLFDGSKTQAEVMADYNTDHPLDPIDLDVLKDFEKSLNEMHLLEKSSREMNVMLVEKMRETRKSMLLSKEGSLMYKRFPLIDPDRFFDKIIPHLWFFWTKGFLFLSIATMLLAMILVGLRLDEFTNGVYEVFSFSKLSIWNLAFLWITIYAVIAIHEFGHGLTCKRYGGEVHEIGFLLLFFQPCLYANVNDAWLFDKKWKQVMVTIAGGYIEFFVGAIFGILWAITNPNTLINVLSLQIMTICSLSTVIFNFNPLVKLDGYYLLADFLEVPNLRDSSFSYLKWLASTKVFRNKEDPPEATKREEFIYLAYGTLSFFWVASTTFGLFYMAKGLLIDHLQAIGVVLSFWVAYKIFGGHVKKSKAFLIQWLITNRELLTSNRGKKLAAGIVAAIALLFATPLPYRVPGKCSLSASHSTVIRASSDGIIRSFNMNDGALFSKSTEIFVIENPSLETDIAIAEIDYRKTEAEVRAALKSESGKLHSYRKELTAKRASLERLRKKRDDLRPSPPTRDVASVLSCPEQTRKLNTFVKDGDEICRVHDIEHLKAVIEVPEHEVRFIEIGNEVQFRLESHPLITYRGKVNRIQSLGIPDPINPKARLYNTELIIDNPGDLRPGMTGLARVSTGWIPAVQYLGRRLASFFRLDLFF